MEKPEKLYCALDSRDREDDDGPPPRLWVFNDKADMLAFMNDPANGLVDPSKLDIQTTLTSCDLDDYNGANEIVFFTAEVLLPSLKRPLQPAEWTFLNDR